MLLLVLPGITVIATTAVIPPFAACLAHEHRDCDRDVGGSVDMAAAAGMSSPMLDSVAALMAWRVGIPQTTLGTIVASVLWVARELVWWYAASVLAGFLACFALELEMGRWARRGIRGVNFTNGGR